MNPFYFIVAKVNSLVNPDLIAGSIEIDGFSFLEDAIKFTDFLYYKDFEDHVDCKYIVHDGYTIYQ